MKRIYTLIASASLLAATTTASQAAVIGVGTEVSSAGTATAIIAAPAQVSDSTVFNTGIQVFDEKQGVDLLADILFDGGLSTGAGQRVDSHMIFLNKKNGTANLSHGTSVSFSGLILGVMSDSGGTLEAATNTLLGAAGTAYPGGFTARGLEGNDNYSVSGNTISIFMTVSQPGDWVRVVTVAPVPVPGSLALLGSALVGAAALRRRKKAA